MRKFFYVIFMVCVVGLSANTLQAMDDRFGEFKKQMRAQFDAQMAQMRQEMDSQLKEKDAEIARLRAQVQDDVSDDLDAVKRDVPEMCSKVLIVLLASSEKKPSAEETKKWIKSSDLLKKILSQAAARNIPLVTKILFEKVSGWLAGEEDDAGDDAGDGTNFLAAGLKAMATKWLKKSTRQSGTVDELVGHIIKTFELDSRHMDIELYHEKCISPADIRKLRKETCLPISVQQKMLPKVFKKLGFKVELLAPEEAEEEGEDERAWYQTKKRRAASRGLRDEEGKARWVKWKNFSRADLNAHDIGTLRRILSFVKACRKSKQKKEFQQLYIANVVPQGGKVPSLQAAIQAIGKENYRQLEAMSGYDGR